MPDKLIGVALIVTDAGTKHDQTMYAKSIVIEGIRFFQCAQSFNTT